jgi:hypothetical protein
MFPIELQGRLRGLNGPTDRRFEDTFIAGELTAL